MDVVTICYQMTATFPKSEVYGLSSQIQRASVSLPANIAEGHQRKHSKEFIQFLSIASGSLEELETHIYIAQRLGYIDEEQLNNLLDKTSEIGRMVNGLRKSIEKKVNADL